MSTSLRFDTSLRFRRRRHALLVVATSFLSVFSLACLASVDGERAATGECPEGETCSGATPDGLEFVGRAFFDEPTLRLGPVLVGGSFELGLRAQDGAPLPAFAASSSTNGMRVTVGDGVFGPTTEDGEPYYLVDSYLVLRATSAGVAQIRVTDPATGELYDRLSIEAVELDAVDVVVAQDPDRPHLYAGCDEMVGVRLMANNGTTRVRGFDEGMRVRADGTDLEEEPFFWDCVVYPIPAGATEVAFDVDVAGRSFRRTMPVSSLADDGLAECPAARD